MVCMMSALSSTVSALRGEFGHSLPCRILKIPGAPEVRCSFAFQLGKTERSIPSYFGRPLASVDILLVSSMMMLFCCNWCVLSCAAAGAGFLCPNARTCRCAIEPSCRLRAGFSVLGTRSTYLGPNARICRCALEPSCRVLASLAVTGTESTSPGPNARIYPCILEPSFRVLAVAVLGTESTYLGPNARI